MLNKLLLGLLDKSFSRYFSILVDKYVSGTQTYYGFSTMEQHGDLKPRIFSAGEIIDISQTGVYLSILFPFNELEPKPTVYIKRLDNGKLVTLVYNTDPEAKIKYQTTLSNPFFTDADVGKWIELYIDTTPPQVKALFASFIKAAKGWLHSLCASLFVSVEVVNA